MFFLSKVESIFLRYNLQWSIFYWTLRWKLFKMTTLGNIWVFFSLEFSFGKTLPKHFWVIGEYILLQYPWIHPGSFPDENEANEISSRWKRFLFSTSPMCVGNLSLPERYFELLMFPSDFLKFWYFPDDIAQTVSFLTFMQAINSCFTMKDFMWTFLV